jgi:GH15 family glucan-1,4-alpha-glucosidase
VVEHRDGVGGERRLPELELPELEGYRGSRPVRVGNAAATQRQLDIYGEVLRAASLHYQHRAHPTGEAWQVLRGLVDQAVDHWTESGRGIWEVRGGPRPFLYGKLMCWAAVDTGLRLAKQHRLEAPIARWEHARGEMRQAILDRGYDPGLGAFTQALDESDTLDASALAIPRIGFLPATDPRVQSTVSRIQRNLTHDGLVYRYRSPDGLAGGEGTFTLCTFWLVDALALGGRVDQAEALFERTLSRASDLGLLSEEIEPETGEQVGNFPQGFSHLALIGAAVNLAKSAERGAEDQPKSEAMRAGPAGHAASSRATSRPG